MYMYMDAEYFFMNMVLQRFSLYIYATFDLLMVMQLCVVYLRKYVHRCAVPSLQWRHNGLYGVSNHHTHDCLLNRLFRRRSKKTLKLCVTGLCAGNSMVTDELPAQRTSNAENVAIWWRHHIGCSGYIPSVSRSDDFSTNILSGWFMVTGCSYKRPITSTVILRW